MTNTNKVPSTNEAYVTKRGSRAPNKKAAHGPPMIWWAMGGSGAGKANGSIPLFFNSHLRKRDFFKNGVPTFE